MKNEWMNEWMKNWKWDKEMIIPDCIAPENESLNDT